MSDFLRAQELLRAGRVEEGRGLLERIVAADSGHGPARHILGVLAIHRQDWFAAADHLAAARLRVKSSQELERALAMAVARCATAPLAERWGWAERLLADGRLAEARALVEGWLREHPGSAAGWSVLGRIADREARPREALDAMRRALELAPANPAAMVNLGSALIQCADFAGARRWLVEVIRCGAGESGEYALAMLDLLEGNPEEGWRRYRFRPRKPPTTGLPAWDGEPAPKATLVLYTEQGIGTIIQFARFLERVRPLVSRVVLLTPPPLVPLLRGWGNPAMACLPPESIVPWADRSRVDEPGDCVASLMDLPTLLRWGRDSVQPHPTPLFAPSKERIQEVSSLLPPANGRLRVGLHWKGNPRYLQDQYRSPALRELLPMLDVEGVEWWSFQKGTGAGELADLPPQTAARVLDLGCRLDRGESAFEDTAAALHACDLLVTADSAIAHLAGAMHRPVWLLLPHVPDWRWGLSGVTTPWYSSMRLFRQSAAGDWRGLAESVARELAAWKKGPSDSPGPLPN